MWGLLQEEQQQVLIEILFLLKSSLQHTKTLEEAVVGVAFFCRLTCMLKNRKLQQLQFKKALSLL